MNAPFAAFGKPAAPRSGGRPSTAAFQRRDGMPVGVISGGYAAAQQQRRPASASGARGGAAGDPTGAVALASFTAKLAAARVAADAARTTAAPPPRDAPTPPAAATAAPSAPAHHAALLLAVKRDDASSPPPLSPPVSARGVGGGGGETADEAARRAAQRDREAAIRSKLKSAIAAPGFDGHATADFYAFGKVLGTGSFGEVRLAWHRLAGVKCAVKCYDKARLAADAANLRRVQQEIRLMERLNHPGVIRMLEAIDTPKRILIVMELANAGNLCEYVKARGRLGEAEARRVFLQLLVAVEYLHDRGVIHRDIKLENVLLCQEEGGSGGNSGGGGGGGNVTVKLVDFGFSVFVRDPAKKLKIACGTPSYMPPEITQRREYVGGPVDVWSLAVLLYAMLVGHFPFTAKTYPELYKKIAAASLAFPDHVSQPARDLLRRMLHPDPAKRLPLASARSHPWVAPALAAVGVSPAGAVAVPPPSEHSLLISEDPASDLREGVIDRLTGVGFRRARVVEAVLSRQRNAAGAAYYLTLARLGRSSIAAAAAAAAAAPSLQRPSSAAAAQSGGHRSSPTGSPPTISGGNASPSPSPSGYVPRVRPHSAAAGSSSRGGAALAAAAAPPDAPAAAFIRAPSPLTAGFRPASANRALGRSSGSGSASASPVEPAARPVASTEPAALKAAPAAPLLHPQRPTLEQSYDYDSAAVQKTSGSGAVDAYRPAVRARSANPATAASRNAVIAAAARAQAPPSSATATATGAIGAVAVAPARPPSASGVRTSPIRPPTAALLSQGGGYFPVSQVDKGALQLQQRPVPAVAPPPPLSAGGAAAPAGAPVTTSAALAALLLRRPASAKHQRPPLSAAEELAAIYGGGRSGGSGSGSGSDWAAGVAKRPSSAVARAGLGGSSAASPSAPRSATGGVGATLSKSSVATDELPPSPVVRPGGARPTPPSRSGGPPSTTSAVAWMASARAGSAAGVRASSTTTTTAAGAAGSYAARRPSSVTSILAAAAGTPDTPPRPHASASAAGRPFSAANPPHPPPTSAGGHSHGAAPPVMLRTTRPSSARRRGSNASNDSHTSFVTALGRAGGAAGGLPAAKPAASSSGTAPRSTDFLLRVAQAGRY